MKSPQLMLQQDIENKIFLIRNRKVMLDYDLAILYGTLTKRLNEQVKRNAGRFPEDFMFQLTKQELKEVVANCDHLRNIRFSHSLPYAFTEHGILMLSSVLNSDKAIEVNIQIMRTFTKLRALMEVHKDLREKIEDMERKYDAQFQMVFRAVKKLLEPPKPKKPRVPYGFQIPKLKE
jgi:hypothetical protein